MTIYGKSGTALASNRPLFNLDSFVFPFSFSFSLFPFCLFSIYVLSESREIVQGPGIMEIG
jgi:hypothetical protein